MFDCDPRNYTRNAVFCGEVILRLVNNRLVPAHSFGQLKHAAECNAVDAAAAVVETHLVVVRCVTSDATKTPFFQHSLRKMLCVQVK
jgi:hypothetical protein